jgi:TrmH family RNA methyltransferase
MLSKSAIKYINSLRLKKFRQRYSKFTAEGDKIVKEILQDRYIQPEYIYCIPEWQENNRALIREYNIHPIIISPLELKKISNLQTPNQVLAVLSQLENHLEDNHFKNNLSLVLQTIQDPGNLGTILRIADWFGIPQVICSRDCVDIYNYKVVQASMGAFLRVNVVYDDIEKLFEQYPTIPKYGALLGGKNLFQSKLSPNGFLVIGNESKGISSTLQKHLTHQIEIPANGKAESLNAAVATGIICAVFRNL